MMQNIKSMKAVKGDVGKPLTAFFIWKMKRIFDRMAENV